MGKWYQEQKEVSQKRRRKMGMKSIVFREVVLSGRRLGEKRLFDIGWSDESKCQACHEEEGTEKHRIYHCPTWYEIRRDFPGASR